MGEARVMLVARRGGRSGQASSRCPAFVQEAPYSRRQVLSGGCIVSSLNVAILHMLPLPQVDLASIVLIVALLLLT